MSERFSILQKHFALNTGKAEISVQLTAYALHIYCLRIKCQDKYMPTGTNDQKDIESNTSVDYD